MKIYMALFILFLLPVVYAFDCTDSDGNNPFVRGVVTYLGEYEDFCYDEIRLKERLCIENELAFEWYECENGCFDGACRSYCGNGICNGYEDCSSCPEDCGACCGNSIIDEDENCDNCPEDMMCAFDEECVDGKCVVVAYCGDGVCNVDEDCSSCSDDCVCDAGFRCEDGICVELEERYTILYILGIIVVGILLHRVYKMFKRKRRR